MEKLKLAIVQSAIEWHKPEQNILHFGELLNSLRGEGIRIAVLPEMWSTGFTMKAEKYAVYHDDALDHMKQWSLEHGFGVIGSLICPEDGKYYNRLYYVDGGAVLDYYDKRHLFAYSGENLSFTAGNKKKIINIDGWNICLNICYDLRFPVWSRNYEDYDVLLYSANWPDKRSEAWLSLLKARAIENQCYCIGVNCVGEDVWKNSYSGLSLAVDFKGSTISEIPQGEQQLSITLEKSALTKFREEFPFLGDRDNLSDLRF